MNHHYKNFLIKYLKPQLFIVLVLSILILGNIALQLISPQIIRFYLDAAESGSTIDVLVRAAILFLIFALIQQVLTVISTYVSETVAWSATNNVRSDLGDHCLHLDLSFHNAHTPGEMIERLDGDVTALSNFFSQFVIQIIGNVILLIGILILLWRIDWRVGISITVFSLLAFFIMARFSNIAVPHWTAERQASADFFGFLEERLSGTEDIRANGGKDYVMRKFYLLMRGMLDKSLRAAMMINVLLNATILIFTLGNATAFGVSAFLFKSQVITIGTVYLIFHYTNMLERPINQITRQLEDFQRAGAGITRIRELLDTKGKILDKQSAPIPDLYLKDNQGFSVEFSNVTFGYDDAIADNSRSEYTQDEKHLDKEIVLENLTFKLDARKVLGLLGRTGSGKTTLIRLLLRLFEPDSGQILINTEPGESPSDISSLPLQYLRQTVGLVTQDIQLFNASIRDNLSLFNPNIIDSQIVNVIDEMGLNNWFKKLPNGLDTTLKTATGGISAGEAQLLAFARIFLRDPKIVILDEASSRLDPATEELLEQAIKRLITDRTAIIIAHRLNTVLSADEILILQNGKVLEHGDRLSLSSDPESKFSHLLKTGLEEVLV
jgi:ABC-type multidrug transport system fused ATPase/permease subunit